MCKGFTKHLRGMAQVCAWSLCALLLTPVVVAQEKPATPQFIEGTHYTRITPSREVKGTPEGKIVVQEFFWYGCPHCYQLEPYIEQWEPADDVHFERLPAALGATWQIHAYIYYAIEALGKEDELHAVFFEAIHGKKLKLTSAKQVSKFFASHGVDTQKFEKALRSFVVDANVKQADKQVQDYEITGVPVFVVNGRYKLSPGSVGSYENTMRAIDHLVGLERKRITVKKRPN